MEALYPVLLAVSAFWLGACPFSLWIGRRLLGKDIREYGDGNPGAANVFRAGGRKSGCLAVAADMGKGVPFMVLGHSLFGLPGGTVMAIGLAAILGSVFSPMLRFRGGKSLAVTGGVLLALPQRDITILVAAFLLLGVLFVEQHGWIVVFGAAGPLVYLAATRRSPWELLFMLGVLVVVAAKHREELKTVPGFGVRPVNWLRARQHKA